MDPWNGADLQALLVEREGPCVSLFLPVHHQDPQQDRLRFREMISEAEERLQSRGMRPASVRDFLTPLHDLQNDLLFWRKQSDGVAVFLASGFFQAYRLPWSFSEELSVGRVFLVIPLLPMLALDGPFYVLAVGQKRVRLFQGTHFTISQMDLNGLPRSLAETMQTPDSNKQLSLHAQPAANSDHGAGSAGPGVGTDDEENNLLRYFQKIDRGLRTLFREERAPLVLAAPEHIQPIYREANCYPHLTELGIIGNPDQMSSEDLHQQVWELVSPIFADQKSEALSCYQEARLSGKATSDSAQTILAAIGGEVSTLFIALDDRVHGALNFQQSMVTAHVPEELDDEDLSNFAAVCTLRHGHAVHVICRAEMPEKSTVAAICFQPVDQHVERSPSG